MSFLTRAAPPNASYLTVVAESQLTNEQAVRNLLPSNEFYWPPPVGNIDLDANGQWWRKVGTPSTAPTMTTATTAGIATTYGEKCIKCIAAASGDGLKSTWTYANEKRVKSGAYMSALVAIYLVTAARTLTISLVTSVPTTVATATVTTTGSWQLVALEPGSSALDGTTVDFKVTADGAATFYVVPLGAVISTAASPRALPLPLRELIYIQKDSSTSVLTVTGDNNSNTFTDNDLTSALSSLAVMVNLQAHISEAVSGFDFYNRRKGDSGGGVVVATSQSNAAQCQNMFTVVLDDSQVWQYKVNRFSGSSTLDFGELYAMGYWEWG